MISITDGRFRKAGDGEVVLQLFEKFAETLKLIAALRQDIATELVGTREKK